MFFLLGVLVGVRCAPIVSVSETSSSSVKGSLIRTPPELPLPDEEVE